MSMNHNIACCIIVKGSQDLILRMKFNINHQLIRERKAVILGEIENVDSVFSLSDDAKKSLRERIRNQVEQDESPLNKMERGVLLQGLLDDLFGFGPISSIMRDPSTRNINVYCDYTIEKDGHKCDETFEGEKQFEEFLSRLIFPDELLPGMRKFEQILSNGTIVHVDLDNVHPEFPIVVLSIPD